MLPWTVGSSRTICQRFIASTQIRNASILTKLRPIPGSQVNSTRLGRGPGNKKGKTSGRGTKGQNSRAGGGNAYFEGGQTPIHIRFPKIGHNTSYTSTLKLIDLVGDD
jgi:large subunit ribosomal protein L15